MTSLVLALLLSASGQATGRDVTMDLSARTVQSTGSTTARKLKDRFADTVNVKDFGAKGDGVTDDTAAIQAAINAAAALPAGGRVVFGPGQFLALSLNLPSGVTLDLRGAEIIKNGGDSTTSIVAAIGTITATAPALTADVVLGATTVSVTDATVFAVGDVVLVYDSTVTNPAGGAGEQGRNQELNRVAAASGTTVTLANPTIGSYATTSSATIAKMAAVQHAAIVGGKMSIPPGTRGGVIKFVYTCGCEVRDMNIAGPYDLAGVYVMQSAYFNIESNYIHDCQATGAGVSTGYPVMVHESSHHGTIRGNRFVSYTSIPFTNNSRHMEFTGNVCRGFVDSAVNTHGTGVKHILIADNTIEGGTQYGIAVGYSTAPVGDADITISGNAIRNIAKHGISITSQAGKEHSRLAVTGNAISAFGLANGGYYGVYASRINGLTVTGNSVSGAGSPGSGSAILFSYVTDGMASGNRADTMANGYGFQATNCTRLNLVGNHASGIVSHNFYLTTSTACRVLQNSADDTTVSIDAGAYANGNSWQAAPNVPSGGSTTIGAGIGSVKMSTANAATNTAWIPIQYAGTTYYVPAWTTNAP